MYARQRGRPGPTCIAYASVLQEAVAYAAEKNVVLLARRRRAGAPAAPRQQPFPATGQYPPPAGPYEGSPGPSTRHIIPNTPPGGGVADSARVGDAASASLALRQYRGQVTLRLRSRCRAGHAESGNIRSLGGGEGRARGGLAP
jgi:hypothetical protein